MSRSILISILILSITFMVGCSDSTKPNEGTVNVVSEMSNSLVSIFPDEIRPYNLIQANEVDSIKVISVRILLSEMKLHPSKTDTTSGKILKTAPFLFQIDNSGKVIQLTSTSIPVGNYEKIKFEFHRFSSSEINQYQNDGVFKDFATADRYTVIILGKYYKNNVSTDFTYYSKITANLSFNFDPAIEVSSGAISTISLQIDPILFFKKSGNVLNPSDSKNISDIENSIKNTIKVLKR